MCAKINDHRLQINQIDSKLIALLSKRMAIAKKIGVIKQKNKIKILDKNRENKILVKVKELAKKSSVNEQFSEKIFKLIIKESKRIQNEK